MHIFLQTVVKRRYLIRINLLELLTLDNIYKFRVAVFAHKILIQQTDIPEILIFSLITLS